MPTSQFVGFPENLIVQICDRGAELIVVIERDGRNIVREEEDEVGVGVELEALVFRLGFETASAES